MTEFRKSLDALEQIRVICGSSEELSLPQICVVGDQSSGKSTLLGSLVPGLDEVLPQGSGTCTVAPIVVQLCRGEPHKVEVNARSFNWDKAGRTAAHVALRQCQSALDFRTTNDSFEHIRNSEGTNSSRSNAESLSSDIPAVIVRVTHPQVTDLTVVDLPGIVQVGAGRERVERMIQHYISSPDCLIVVVKPANDDLETAAAARFSIDADPFGARTLTVLTKCDVFSETANKIRVVEEVRRGANDPRGPHAVCCRKKVDGDEAPWTADAEDDWFRSDPDFAELKHIGSKSLAGDRLPTLLSQLIKSNVPRLRFQIHNHLAAAAAELRQLGEKKPEKSDIQNALKMHLQKNERNLQGELTTILRALRNNLDVHKEKLQLEWVSERCKFNAFDPIFFQGKDAFDSCMRAIVFEWWTADVDRSIEEVLVVIRKHIMTVHSFAEVTDELVHAFLKIWESKQTLLEKKMRAAVTCELESASKFGTLQECWDKSLSNGDQKTRDILKEIRDDFVMRFKAKHDRHLHRNDLVNWIDEHIKRAESSFKEEKIDEQNESMAADIVKRQEGCVYRCLHSYYDVVFNRTLDNLLSCIRDTALKAWRQFVQDTLVSDKSLLDACGEDSTRTCRREILLARRQRMMQCEQQLDEVF